MFRRSVCIFAAIVAVVLVTLVAVSFRRYGQRQQPNATTSPPSHAITAETFSPPIEARVTYPYSIVPGGAKSVSDVKAELAMLPSAIRAQYAGINMADLRLEHLKTSFSGYASYRDGDEMYWTSKKMTIPSGEAVFTDGTTLIRGRCVNLFSAQPMGPVQPNGPVEQLDVPTLEFPPGIYISELPPLPELPQPPGEVTPSTSPSPPPAVGPASPSTPGKGGGGIWFPIPFPIPIPIHHHPPPTLPVGSPPVGPPTRVTPEPTYIGVLVVAFFVMVMVTRRRRHRR